MSGILFSYKENSTKLHKSFSYHLSIIFQVFWSHKVALCEENNIFISFLWKPSQIVCVQIQKNGSYVSFEWKVSLLLHENVLCIWQILHLIHFVCDKVRKNCESVTMGSRKCFARPDFSKLNAFLGQQTYFIEPGATFLSKTSYPNPYL